MWKDINMKRKGDTLLLFAIFISLSCHVVGQQGGIFCKEACSVGFTCAMVQVGNGEAKPDCINQYETELLAKALREQSSKGPGNRSPAPVTENVQRDTGTHENTIHSHDTAHGIVTHQHEIPAQTPVTNNDPVPPPRNAPPTNPMSNSFDFPRSSLPFNRQAPFDRFMTQRPLRFFHRGRFVPIQSLHSGSDAFRPLFRTGSASRTGFGTGMIPGLPFSGGSADRRRRFFGSGMSMSSFGDSRPAMSFNRPRSSGEFSAFPLPGQCGRRCNSHLECSPTEFCGRNTLCRGAIVCQAMF